MVVVMVSNATSFALTTAPATRTAAAAVTVLLRQVHRPMLEPDDRAVLAGLAQLLPRQRLGRLFVQPATLPHWNRDPVAKRWTYSHGQSEPGSAG